MILFSTAGEDLIMFLLVTTMFSTSFLHVFPNCCQNKILIHLNNN